MDWVGLDGALMIDQTSMQPMVNQAGNYVLEIIDNSNGCIHTDTVSVYERSPDLGLQLMNGEVVEVELGEEVFLDALVDRFDFEIERVEWVHDGTIECGVCLSSMAYPVEDVTYHLTVIDIYGCSQSSVIEVLVRERIEYSDKMYIPNIIYPSNGGEDAVFRVFGDDNIDLIESISIHDRWGNTVFEVIDAQPEDARATWDGSYDGQPLNSGVYIYRIELLLNNGRKMDQMGSISIVN